MRYLLLKKWLPAVEPGLRRVQVLMSRIAKESRRLVRNTDRPVDEYDDERNTQRRRIWKLIKKQINEKWQIVEYLRQGLSLFGGIDIVDGSTGNLT